MNGMALAFLLAAVVRVLAPRRMVRNLVTEGALVILVLEVGLVVVKLSVKGVFWKLTFHCFFPS
jgi:hypothetical protein